jgi:hypothetical protein
MLTSLSKAAHEVGFQADPFLGVIEQLNMVVYLCKICPDIERHDMQHKDTPRHVATHREQVFMSLNVLPLLTCNTTCLYTHI